MIFEDKPITLKDGRTAILKSPCVEDAEKLLNYIKTSCGETEYLARYPEAVSYTHLDVYKRQPLDTCIFSSQMVLTLKKLRFLMSVHFSKNGIAHDFCFA